MRAPRWLLCAALVVLPACGVPEDDQPRALDASGLPRVLEREIEPAPLGDLAAELWLVRGDQLVQVERQVPQPGRPNQVLRSLFNPVTEPERSAGLTSSIPAAVSFVDVEVRDRIAVVTLEGPVDQLSALPFAQIVLTLDSRPDIDGVRFRTEEGDISVPRGSGALTPEPLNRQSYAELLGLAASAVPPPPVAPAPDAPAAETATDTTQPGPGPAAEPAAEATPG